MSAETLFTIPKEISETIPKHRSFPSTIYKIHAKKSTRRRVEEEFNYAGMMTIPGTMRGTACFAGCQAYFRLYMSQRCHFIWLVTMG